MKRLSVLLLASFALISCGNKPSLSESFSDFQNEESLQESQADESESSESVQESEFSSSESESAPEIDEEDKVFKYTSHPTSEPHINYQLHTLSAIGDIYSVWEHYRGDGVKVAVIDNNFRVTHEDFYFENGQSKITFDSARIYKSGSKVITEVGVDKAGIDASSNWHGTMCAGLLGASVNGKGTTGIAPNCDLTLIKVDNSPEAIAEAFKYAADCGVKVISISLGNYALSSGATYGDIVYPKGFDLSTAFNESINYAYKKGVTIVSAVGNDKKTTLTYPAGCENVIGAGGLQSGSLDKMWDDGGEGTNYNGTNKYVDVYAPSSGIYTPGSQSNSGYMDGPNAKGTSFSAPIIAGAAALYFQKYPTHTNKDFETALQKTCRNISSANSNKDTGWGALDVYKLLNLNEDVEDVYFQPTKTINEEATTIRIYDENSWCFRSLHTWGFEFEDGYGYRDLEYFFLHQYGQRTLTKNYQIESEKRSWAYTDEYFVGDYFLNAGSLTGAYYEFNFPSWVKSFSYQSVNNNHWIPENGGYNTGNKSAYKKVSNVYINNGQTYLVVDSKTNTISMPAIEISFEGSLSINPITQSVYNYFDIEENGKAFFLDKNKNELYYRQIFRQNTILYVSDI